MTVLALHPRPDEAGGILALWRRFMAEERGAVPEADAAAAEAGWATRLGRQLDASKVVALDDGRSLVGFLAFLDHDDRAWIPPGIAYVVDLYIVPEARSGAAFRELAWFAAGTLGAAYRGIWTNTHAGNRRMQVLLRRAGFRPLEGFGIPGLGEQRYFRLDRAAGGRDPGIPWRR